MTFATNIFDSFNARFLSPEKVATTFVAPSQFAKVAERSNTLLVGPRGSGKTTLLKMLTPAALNAWQGEQRDKIASKVEYLSAFIPADIAWRLEKDEVLSRSLDAPARNVVERAIVLNHAASALFEAFATCQPDYGNNYLSEKLGLRFDREQEGQLVSAARKIFQIGAGAPAISDLATDFSRLLVELYADLAEATGPVNIGTLRQGHAWITLPLFQTLTHLIGAFEKVVQRKDTRWALLFDEAENLPEVVRQEVFQLLRGTDNRLLLKISMAPVQSEIRAFVEQDGPVAGGDFALVPLWHGEKERNYEFCEQLLESMQKERGLDIRDASAILDYSYFELGRTLQQRGLEVYSPDSAVARRFANLASRDASFAEYLTRKHINLDKGLHRIKDEERAETVRKALSVVTVREAYLGSNGVRRGRKTAALYTGKESIFALSEGNPRTFINIVRPLLDVYQSREQRTVARATQSRAITAVRDQFIQLLESIPGASDGRSAFEFISRIGDRFQDNVLGPYFNAEPVLQAEIDQKIDVDQRETIGRLINRGALIILSEQNGKYLRKGVQGLRVRLSYLIATEFALPLTLGKHRSLTFILRTPDGETQPLFPDAT
jgi:energy-coupling factor transporter ATP-binding protein EcfA2